MKFVSQLAKWVAAIFVVALPLSAAAEVVNCQAPVGMLCIPGGGFYMGRNSSSRMDEMPRHLVKISAFYLDETLVTVSAFRKFVDESKYVTTAEKSGFGMVSMEGMKNWEWKKVKGATWRQPFGAEYKSKIPLVDDHPVVSVSWEDAVAFCKAGGKRLPTEAEWEYASRAGKSDIRYPWGDTQKLKNGRLGLNFWQGSGHEKNEMIDSYLYTSPVKAFPPNDWGVYDPVGNVWQFVSDWYGRDYFQTVASAGGVNNPQGPGTGKKRVARGGSWWCSEKTC
ncbi:MAG: formylglycine-generating enzyme family protein, partial [Bdellovibrionota bacterium]